MEMLQIHPKILGNGAFYGGAMCLNRPLHLLIFTFFYSLNRRHKIGGDLSLQTVGFENNRIFLGGVEQLFVHAAEALQLLAEEACQLYCALRL